MRLFPLFRDINAMSVRQLDGAPPSDETRLQRTDLLSGTPLHYANFIVRHLWPMDFILDQSLKKVAECEMADDVGRAVFSSEHGHRYR